MNAGTCTYILKSQRKNKENNIYKYTNLNVSNKFISEYYFFKIKFCLVYIQVTTENKKEKETENSSKK